jgi:hypothetical protein
MILNNAAKCREAQEDTLPRKKISRSAAAPSRKIRAVSRLAVKD